MVDVVDMVNFTEAFNLSTTSSAQLNSSFDENDVTMSGVTSYAGNVIVSCFIGFMLIVGTVGNVLTIATISSSTRLQTISNYFICSLCVSDLFSALICSPLWLYRRTWGFNEWMWGDFLCKFYWVADFTTNYVTALHIASFAAFRFAAVRKPFKVWDIPKSRILTLILCLWIFSFMIAAPLMLFMGIRDNNGVGQIGGFWPSCSIKEDRVKDYHLYTLIVYPTIFLFPLVLIIMFSSLLIQRLVQQNNWFNGMYDHKSTEVETVSSNIVMGQRFSSTPTASQTNTLDSPDGKKVKKVNMKVKTKKSVKFEKRHRKTFLQLGLVVLSFVLGYIPASVYLIWTSVTSQKNQSTDYWFGVGSYLCLRLSECLNPVMYNLGSSKLRTETNKLLTKMCAKFQTKEV